MRTTLLALLLALAAAPVFAQFNDDNYANGIDASGRMNKRLNNADTLGTDKEIPIGLKVWTVDERFGDRRAATADTVSAYFMNTIFTTGLHGEYNTTGNVGAPRQNRIFTDRAPRQQFLFTQPYDYLVRPDGEFHFTNTLSPITNLSYNFCGDRTCGEDHVTAKFGVNIGKRIGLGFNFDYIYSLGYYQDQQTSNTAYTLYGSYLGERYQLHVLVRAYFQKLAENGGVGNDDYITHPELFNDTYTESEIPTALSQTWNRNKHQHLFLTHRYSLGFKRKVPMTEDEIKARKFALEAKKDEEARKKKEEERRSARQRGEEYTDDDEDDNPRRRQQQFSGRPDGARVVGDEPVAGADSTAARTAITPDSIAARLAADSLALAAEPRDTVWMKSEYVPVTSFIHTAQLASYERIYQAHAAPDGYYAAEYFDPEPARRDSIFDSTKHFSLKNTFAVSFLEGFSKWAKMGVKGFVVSELRHFTLPTAQRTETTYNEHCLSVGGQVSKQQGTMLHYEATGETCIAGEDVGQVKIDGNVQLRLRLLGDTAELRVGGAFANLNPVFYHRHYHARHAWWDGDLAKTIHTRVWASLAWEKTHTQLRFAFDNVKNYTYLAGTYLTADDGTRTQHAVELRQAAGAVSVLTLALRQDLALGPVHWDNIITYQKSSNDNVIPVPALNIYTNLYLRVRIARVLKCDLGADMRFFTKYAAPEYSPMLGQYVAQANEQKVKTGCYPIVNAYANFHLKHARFFVMMSHLNASNGGDSFLTPHYPINRRIVRFGLSWNFFN